jgi:hypothetical protein
MLNKDFLKKNSTLIRSAPNFYIRMKGLSESSERLACRDRPTASGPLPTDSQVRGVLQ